MGRNQCLRDWVTASPMDRNQRSRDWVTAPPVGRNQCPRDWVAARPTGRNQHRRDWVAAPPMGRNQRLRDWVTAPPTAPHDSDATVHLHPRIPHRFSPVQPPTLPYPLAPGHLMPESAQRCPCSSQAKALVLIPCHNDGLRGRDESMAGRCLTPTGGSTGKTGCSEAKKSWLDLLV